MTTKSLATVFCAFVLAAVVAVAQDKKPVNAKCPVKTGEAAKAERLQICPEDFRGCFYFT